jgi:hypothetical protein
MKARVAVRRTTRRAPFIRERNNPYTGSMSSETRFARCTVPGVRASHRKGTGTVIAVPRPMRKAGMAGLMGTHNGSADVNPDEQVSRIFVKRRECYDV